MGGSPRPPPFDVSLSTISFDSMVEIKQATRSDDPQSSLASSDSTIHDDNKYRLIYSKSKVYVNPTAYARDNIPGFSRCYLLAWIPENLLNEKGQTEWDKFVRIEEKTVQDDEDDDVVLIDLPTQRPESYAFSIPLSSIYSLIVNPPSLSSWYGSIVINLISGATLPTLHFHDDESRSFHISPKSPAENRPTTYPPPPSDHAPKNSTWGGEDLLALFICQLSFSHSITSSPSASLFYAANPYSERSSILHRSLSPMSSASSPSQARMALLQSFSQITRHAAHAAQQILSHPLAKPIVPHLPDPVKSLVNVNGDLEWGSWVEKGGVGEFESARVYLARWARIVAEEGERARLREAQVLPSASLDLAEETSSLGIFELLQPTSNLPAPKSSRDPKHPVNEKMWRSWFKDDGTPKVRVEEMRHEVFRRGIAPALRKDVWPLLLGVFDWDVNSTERSRRWEVKQQQYRALKDEWWGVPEVFDSPDVIEERHRIDVDCRRTDRSQPPFSDATPMNEDANDEKGMHMRYSTISPQLSDIGAQAPTNEHIERLASILLTYNFYEKELGDEGYVQGMSDLCAPVYVVMNGDEELTFWCFVEIMDRMKQNFLRDQSGMKKQLSTLQQLISVMDPQLYHHLEKTDGLNLFFCFRWILIAFKREFAFEDVLRLWEVLWTDYYSNNFVLFVALAILESHRDVILRYLVEFDEILKYCNELSMTIELDTTLAQAELLFLSFAQLVADIDRREAESGTSGANSVRQRRRNTSERNDDRLPTYKRAFLSDDLRELLKAGR
ncbi:GTPase-activating protein gyp7 [Grifola frondosa]|uniref:GTPase-activating protein gyp7 n=1 Tax=Grifola frondosa TaxID=5627 RepID=A0A1C7MF58_GRIFR|nr:GTPase-activating protein gyp7 [Grifola frondosa]